MLLSEETQSLIIQASEMRIRPGRSQDAAVWGPAWAAWKEVGTKVSVHPSLPLIPFQDWALEHYAVLILQ